MVGLIGHTPSAMDLQSSKEGPGCILIQRRKEGLDPGAASQHTDGRGEGSCHTDGSHDHGEDSSFTLEHFFVIRSEVQNFKNSVKCLKGIYFHNCCIKKKKKNPLGEQNKVSFKFVS